MNNKKIELNHEMMKKKSTQVFKTVKFSEAIKKKQFKIKMTYIDGKIKKIDLTDELPKYGVIKA